MENKLSDKNNWSQSWSTFKPSILPTSHFVEKYLINRNLNGKKFIEIGGFPGTMSAFFYKKYGANVNFIDFYIDDTIVKSIEEINGIPLGTLKYQETDFFDYKTEGKYEFVFSNGFIEHFENTEDIIKRHIDLMSDNSQLLILLPNLRGLNGLFHKYFDYEIYKIHNLKSMDLNLLKKIMKKYDLLDVKVEYINKPMIWISEGKNTIARKILKKIVRMISLFIKLFPIPCKFLSAYIVISAFNKKP